MPRVRARMRSISEEDEGRLAMPETVNQCDALRRKLRELASSSMRVAPELSEAIQGVLTAANYADQALLDSSLNSFLSCLADVARDIIKREISASESTREALKKNWNEYIDGIPRENFDDLKSIITSIIDEQLASMTKLRDKLVKLLEEKECPVENAQRLEEAIRDWQRLNDDVLKDWPSSDTRPSPINRQAVAEAREAIGRGNFGMRKNELVWGRDQAKKTS
jgi:hypothetical protein